MNKKRILCLTFLISLGLTGTLFLLYAKGIFSLHSSAQSQPLISVVMPTYNRADLLPRSIESILNQTIKDFEFVIVDDGSTDNSIELIRSYQKKDNRIRLIKNEKNCGIACARNRGMDAARGKYLAIMDSDDYSEPNRLEKSLAFFKKHPDYTAVNSIYREIGRDHDINETNNWVPPRRWEIIFNFANYYTNLAMFDLDFVRQHNIRYDETLVSAEDYDFWSRIWLAGGKLGMINEPLLLLRRHTSYSQSYYNNILHMRKVVSARLLKRFDISEQEAFNGDRCELMEKMIQSNAKKNIINQYALVFTYQYQCTPQNVPQGTLYIKHFDFVDYFFPIGNNLYMRAETKEHYKKINQSDTEIIFENAHGVQELFRLQNDGTYGLVEDL